MKREVKSRSDEHPANYGNSRKLFGNKKNSRIAPSRRNLSNDCIAFGACLIVIYTTWLVFMLRFTDENSSADNNTDTIDVVKTASRGVKFKTENKHANLRTASAFVNRAPPKISLQLPTIEDVNLLLDKWHDEGAPIKKFTTRRSSQVENSTGIPPNLLLTYSSNILKERRPRHFYRNIQNSINLYKEALSSSDFTVLFLDDSDCLAHIEIIEPKLVDPFKYETDSRFKGDICRAAALYQHGGYYLDIDLQVIKPFIISDPGITFSSVIEEPGKGFFQAFMGATPYHRILRQTMNNMVRHYDKALIPKHGGKNNPIKYKINYSYIDHLLKQDKGWNMGTRTIKDAFVELHIPYRSKYNEGKNTLEEKSEVYLLQEIHLETSASWYPTLERRKFQHKCCCNFVVHDPHSQKVHFWSRFPGAGQFC